MDCIRCDAAIPPRVILWDVAPTVNSITTLNGIPSFLLTSTSTLIPPSGLYCGVYNTLLVVASSLASTGADRWRRWSRHRTAGSQRWPSLSLCLDDLSAIIPLHPALAPLFALCVATSNSLAHLRTTCSLWALVRGGVVSASKPSTHYKAYLRREQIQELVR
jgi:hypothetical protein